VSDLEAGTDGRPPPLHPVALVGAGPGHPGLLTVRAVECLRTADLVLYDADVPVGLLEDVTPSARRRCGGDIQAREEMIAGARQGLRVVRLVAGDPLVLGHGPEDAAALARAGVPVEVVPGVPVAVGAASFAGIPLTDARYSGPLVLAGLAKMPDANRCWEALARFPGTLVFEATGTSLAAVTEELLRRGMAPTTPAALVEAATTPAQRTRATTLAQLAAVLGTEAVRPGSVFIVGPVVGLREGPSWFEARPLFGRSVLVTRPRDQAADMTRRLRELGAEVLLLPAVEIGGPADWGPVDRVFETLRHYDWLVFTSANGVRSFLGRLRQSGRDLRALGGVRLAVIGPATADALRAYHLEPDLVPEVYTSEGLASALKAHAAGRRVLLARADRGRDVLREELAALADVDQVTVYSQSDATADDPDVLRRVREGPLDFVTLTSSNVARAFNRTLDETARERIRAGAMRLVTISAVTSEAVRESGLPVAAEAGEATAGGVIAALERLAAGPGR
jgi:uroporphyrinogen III methyltransferase/synthase